jgi:hypothetical protein
MVAAQNTAPVDEANPLVGTAPLDKPEWIGNAPPAGEPLYSGITSPARACRIARSRLHRSI